VCRVGIGRCDELPYVPRRIGTSAHDEPFTTVITVLFVHRAIEAPQAHSPIQGFSTRRVARFLLAETCACSRNTWALTDLLAIGCGCFLVRFTGFGCACRAAANASGSSTKSNV
jgi:hypothetical protein